MLMTKGVYDGLYISTPEEIKKGYESTENKEILEHRIKTFEKFVKDWNVKYFFNEKFKWDLLKISDILPGFGGLLDHVIAFVDEDTNYFLLLQPYANPEDICKNNDINEYVAYWKGGFHNPEAYAVVISGDFLTFIEKNLGQFEECKEWKEWEPGNNKQEYHKKNILRISDIHC